MFDTEYPAPSQHEIDRLESWFTTTGGRQFYPWRPEPGKIALDDVAHTLSQINRWGGHTREPYSVAQHSVIVASMLPPEKAAWGLLHDATEAFMGGDIVRPIKRFVPDLMALERGIANAITLRFGLPDGALEDPEVRYADGLALAWECRDLMPLVMFDNPDNEEGLIQGVPEPMRSLLDKVPAKRLEPWPPRMAERAFLHEARRLGIRERP
jgi:hypothetical protein